MKKLFFLFFIFYTNTLLFAQNDSVTIISGTECYLDSWMTKENIIYTIQEQTKVKILARSGFRKFQIKLNDGQVGWINYYNIKEAQLLEIKDSISYRNEPNFSSIVIGRFYKEDTLLINEISADKIHIKVTNKKNITGWISINIAIPVIAKNITDKNSPNLIYRYDVFQKKIMNLSTGNITEKFSFPDAILKKNQYLIYYYPNIIIVNNKKHHNGIMLMFENNLLVKDSLIGKGRNLWIESLPLAYYFRSVNIFNTTTRLNNLALFKSFSKMMDENTFWNIFFNIMKWLIVILFFSIPTIMTFIFIKYSIYIPHIPNKYLKILNWILFFVIFYIFYLYIILHIGYVSPIFFTIIMSLILFFVNKHLNLINRNVEILDYHRCDNCKSVYKTSDLGSEFITKQHSYDVHTWRSYVGSSSSTTYVGSTSVTIKTNYYQNNSTTNPVTYQKYHDHRKCSVCGNKWYIAKWIKKYGHI